MQPYLLHHKPIDSLPILSHNVNVGIAAINGQHESVWKEVASTVNP
jgi:hypothetical protein